MTADHELSRRRLGRTGLEVTSLSMGGAGIGSRNAVTDREAIAAVQYALAQGIHYVDTSPLYGESERRVGLALEGVARRQYILSTKTGTHPDRRGDYSWDGTLWSVENSLRLLKTDTIDLLLVHDPRDERDMEAIFAPRGALEALEHLKAQGVIGFIGLGQRRHDWHRRAILSGRFDVILTYNDYHPLRTTALTGGLLALARQHDVGVLNGSPLAHGLLNGRDPQQVNATLQMTQAERDVAAAQRLYGWCRASHLSMLAVVLQFCLRQPLIDCTLTGAKSVSELAQNLEAIRTPLPETVWADLDRLGLTEDQES
jgi:aryl-alcohol dehydrogenase-like predicted oxidoreductase